jgi:pimeloyl-ACP methyl ester carboxylesterase
MNSAKNMNERQYLARLEAANLDQLSEMLRRPTVEEERVLARYFGEERLARLRGMASRARRRGAPRGNVVVLHGIMGGELTFYPQGESDKRIWLNFARLIFGAVKWLGVTPAMTSEFDVRPTGILKKWYADMLLGLAADEWNVQPFAYDWRLDLAESADALRDKIDGWFGGSQPVNLVAHSMGGLVSRTFILRHQDRWGKEGRLVMLGTPNHGSFAIPQVITGAYDTVRKLALADVKHSLEELLAILNTMPGSMQMLPSPYVMPEMERMYNPATWVRYGVASRLLDVARDSHTRLQKIVDGNRMTYVAGSNQVTKADVADWNRLDDTSGYADSLDGDGTVPHRLGFLFENGKRIPSWFVEAEHGALPNNEDVIAATQQILINGSCTNLPQQPPKPRALPKAAVVATAKRSRELGEEAELHQLSQRIQAQTRGTAGKEPETISPEEIRAQEIVVRSFLSSDTAASGGVTPTRPDSGAPPRLTVARAPRIKVRLIHGGIQECAKRAPDSDAISVGHYLGVAPQNAELALDKAISLKGGKDESDLIITVLHQRGVIGGELGKHFILPDPTQPKRVIVLAGMGQPGTFREPELTVLARELVWLLGRMGRRHLYTVLIGGGAGNLEIPNAVRAWLRGIRRALYEAEAAQQPRIEMISFVERNAGNFILLHRALHSVSENLGKDPEPLEVDYRGPNEAELKKAEVAAKADAKEDALKQLKKRLSEPGGDGKIEAIRMTIRLVRDTFEFAALTSDAAMPQRETQIDPKLIDEANDLLPAAADHATQVDKGNLLGRLLLPGDLRETVIKPPTPLVITLDRSTARIHWEMVALRPNEETKGFDREKFLGTCCGLTRQLRTTFAPLPEPALASGRPLRVLVVADPAEDAPLPGAQEEGEAVVGIFEKLNSGSSQGVEVVALIGPRKATRVAVLEQLINHRFDILHYAGHCFYDDNDPSHCGWIFSGDRRLTVDELNRIDRIPRLVFSNACESGITPQQSDKRSALLAPSFAEAFFARGVGNFICTAWPVDDAAALAFARRFYNGLLGFCSPPEPMHRAMMEARAEIAQMGFGGLQTWGAYQHYGDPNFRVDRTLAKTTPGRPQGAAKKPRHPAKNKARQK